MYLDNIADGFRPAPGRKRPCPADFRERFIEGGWDEVKLEYGARLPVIKRWIEECGGPALRAERRQRSGYGLRRIVVRVMA